MSGAYERTFSVSVPVERAWRAFTDPDELETWFANRFDANTEDGKATAATPGGPVGLEVTEIKDGELLRYRQWAASPSTGIDVTVVFEPAEGGTRITVTHAGFGGDSILQSDSVRRGMDEALADLALYLEHGVRFARHRDIPGRSSLGADLRETIAGVQLADVMAGEFADRVGLQPGDVLLQLGAGAVFSVSDVAFFQREHPDGEEAEIVWSRGAEVCRGRARLGPEDGLVFARRA